VLRSPCFEPRSTASCRGYAGDQHIAQELQVDRVGDGLAADSIGMKVISAIVGGQKTCRLTRVAQHLIRIDYAVEGPARPNLLIERHA